MQSILNNLQVPCQVNGRWQWQPSREQPNDGENVVLFIPKGASKLQRPSEDSDILLAVIAPYESGGEV